MQEIYGYNKIQYASILNHATLSDEALQTKRVLPIVKSN